MIAAFYEKKGSAREVLMVGDLPDPEPGPGEVRVRIAASAVNPTDTKARSGRKGNMAMPFPRVIPHQDGAGTIDRVGPGVAAERVVEVALGPNLPLDGEVLAPSGVISTFASDAESEPALPFRTFLLKNATIRFVLVYLVSPEGHRAAIRDLTAHLARGRLRHSI